MSKSVDSAITCVYLRLGGIALPLGIDQHEFSNPSAEFLVPFWSLNDILEPAEIERQLEEFKKGGFGGAYLHSRTGLLTVPGRRVVGGYGRRRQGWRALGLGNLVL